MIIPIAVTIAAVVLTLVFIRKGVNIGVIMLMNSLFVFIGTGMPFTKALRAVQSGIFSEKTVMLIIILILIMMVENIMRSTGMISQMVDNLKEILGSSRVAAMVLPVVLGLLPSPGGARFSCPMVEEVLGEKSSGVDKAFINYWFRHIWRDGFILYPGAILAAGLMDITVLSFFSHLLLFVVFHGLLGFLFGGLRIPKERIERTRPGREALKGFGKGIFPIVFIIGLYILLLTVTSYALEIAGLATVVLLLFYKRYTWTQFADTFKKALSLKFVLIIVGVMVFKEFLTSSGLMESLVGIISQNNIPREILFVALPFIGGFSSGITVSLVSLSFPILIPLGLNESVWYGVAAFTAGSIGGMVTPLHLCSIMTADFFKVKVDKILSRVAYAEAFMLMLVCIVLALLRWSYIN